MTLSSGSSPFSSHSQGVVSPAPLPASPSYAQPYPRRVRAFLEGRAVLDTEGAWMLHAADEFMTLWFPRSDIDIAALPAGALTDPPSGDGPVAEALRAFASFDPALADRWFVEDDPVYAQIRDPFHRVDVLSSHRHVRVEHAGVVLAETRRPKLLFETGLSARYYIPWADVNLELLTLSGTISECPYKGDGQHWNSIAGPEQLDDVAWSLPHALPEAFPAAEHICFYHDKVRVLVDGRHVQD